VALPTRQVASHALGRDRGRGGTHPIGGPKSPVPSGASIPIPDLPGNVLIVTPEVPDLGANGDVFPAMDPLMDVSPSLACFRPNLGSDPDNPGDPPTAGPEPDNDADDDGIPVEGLGHGLDADNVICTPDKKIVPNLTGLGLQPVPLTPELVQLGATQLPLTAAVKVSVLTGPVKLTAGFGI
jgi:hypothetical protein